MSLSCIPGPLVTTGNINPAQTTDSGQGPSLFFQGSGVLDPRFDPIIGAAPSAPTTKAYGVYANPFIACVDAMPVTLGTARLAASATQAAAAVSMVTAQAAGVVPNLPILPFGAAPVAANLVTVIGLDAGFCPGNTASNTTLTIPAGAWRFFRKGMRIWVAGANGTSAAPLFTTVAATPTAGATTVTMADAASATTTNCVVGTAHPTLNCAWPYALAGDVAVLDPTQAITRAVSVSAQAAATWTTATVAGYDLYGQAMTEAITISAGGTANGKKAFKYITGVTLSGGTADTTHTYSVGTLDILGLSIRSDFWEYMNVFVAGAFITASTGWTVADGTVPATSTTGDVRGTYALQTASNWDGTTANWAAARRTAMFTSLPMYNAVNATNLNYQTLYGSTQA